MKFKEIIRLIPCFYPPFLVFLLHTFILSPMGIYTKFNWMDIPMHFLGGFTLAYSFILVLRRLNKEIKISSRFIEIFVIIGFVMIVAVLWEFYEYLMDIILKTPINNYENTLLDLFMGLLGGLTAIINLKVK